MSSPGMKSAMELTWFEEEFDVDEIVPIMASAVSSLTILSCLVMKVPQIYSICSKRSADGIYIEAMMMEIVGFTIMTLYNYTNNYALMTYLEYPIILFQVYVMMYYVLMYKGVLDMTVVPLMTAIYFATVASFVMELFPKDILYYLVPLCTPMSGFAKVAYIYGIVKTGSAEDFSITTWIISMLTNLARVFTVYVDSADPRLMFNFIVATVLSSALLTTILFYKSRPCPTHRVPRKKPGRRSHND